MSNSQRIMTLVEGKNRNAENQLSTICQDEFDKAKEFANPANKKASEMHYHWPKVEAEELLKEISH